MFWAVVETQPTCETRAQWHMKYQGFTTYAPREKIKRMVRGRKINTARWLFPRYLFVWFEERWQTWFNTIGVSTVLMNGQEPAKLPEGWVEGMKAQERGGLITLTNSRFRKGQRVQVSGGLLVGQRGLYQGQSSRQREIVLLDALGRVEMASELLRDDAVT